MTEPCHPLIWHFGQIGSSLDVAYTLAKRGLLAPFDSVFCISQTAGRGQMRRNWTSPPGNIYASLRLPYDPPFTTDYAAPATGCLLICALQALGISAKIKWPNDLVSEEQKTPAKLGGILLEERGGIVLAGIGINLCSCPDPASLRQDHVLPATSLSALGFSDLLPQKFWQALVIETIKAYKETDTFAVSWPKRLSPFLLWLGERVEVERLGEASALPCSGLLRGLGPNGGFLLAQNGTVREIIGSSLRRC
ncbi:MAG: biotin--acetyl-CoA-carboxylase ligase [Desulfovibrio sp.]|nr:biotin--acetyl-CoA-carboxylase ligase [Desulfovibrio sp.]